MTAARDEAEAHVRAAVPDAGPAPADIALLYTWMRTRTEHLAPGRQRARDQVIYRQGLEAAIAVGDTAAVRPHPCPACGCVGLFWQKARQAAVCVNRHCRDQDGLAHAWTLARLAHEHVARTDRLKSAAT
ncbi:hypothetical protein [Streptomyces zhihengii]